MEIEAILRSLQRFELTLKDEDRAGGGRPREMEFVLSTRRLTSPPRASGQLISRFGKGNPDYLRPRPLSSQAKSIAQSFAWAMPRGPINTS